MDSQATEAAHRAFLHSEASKRANGDPLPGPLAGAFAGGPIKIGPLEVRKVVAWDWVLFKALKSPILELVLEILQAGNDRERLDNLKVDFTEEQHWELCWQFTRPPREVKAVFDQGVDKLRERALEDIGMTLEKELVYMIGRAVMEQIKRSWTTPLRYAAEAEEKGEITFFPDSSRDKATDSAGG